MIGRIPRELIIKRKINQISWLCRPAFQRAIPLQTKSQIINGTNGQIELKIAGNTVVLDIVYNLIIFSLIIAKNPRLNKRLILFLLGSPGMTLGVLLSNKFAGNGTAVSDFLLSFFHRLNSLNLV